MRRSVLFLLLVCSTARVAAAQPVRRDYFDGDWVSYVVQRYITGLAQGFEVVYSATPYGVGRYSGLRNRHLPPLTASSGLDDPQVLRIAYDDQTATLWVETPLGAYSYNDAIHEWRRGGDFPGHLVRDDAAALRYDNLFTPFELAYFPPDRGAPYGLFRDGNLRTYPISTAHIDVNNRNRVFIGTWGRGLGEIDAISRQVSFRPFGLYQPVVQALHRDGDNWYFGGRGPDAEPPVISVFDTRDSTWTYQQPFYTVAAAGDITAITSSGDRLFCGTPAGLLRYDRKAERWRKYGRFDGLPDDHITALFPDGRLLWVGTPQGPGLLDPQADTGRPALSLATPGIGAVWVYAFARADGYIWAGTETGLYRIRPEAGEWSRITTSAGLLRGHVRGLAVRPEGIWCATDRGLLLLDSLLEAREVFRSGVEFTDGDLYNLAVDDHNIWAGSRSGVWRYRRDRPRWRLYTRADGLLEDFVWDLALDGDYIWFGSETGVTRFYWNNSLRID